MRFLIVEDDDGVRDVLADQLRERGHDVVAVASLRQGRDALDNGRFDVLVVDMKLPDGRGLNLAGEASARGCRPVIMSGNTGAVRSMRDRHLPLLQKPFTIDDLLATIHVRAAP